MTVTVSASSVTSVFCWKRGGGELTRHAHVRRLPRRPPAPPPAPPRPPPNKPAAAAAAAVADTCAFYGPARFAMNERSWDGWFSQRWFSQRWFGQSWFGQSWFGQ